LWLYLNSPHPLLRLPKWTLLVAQLQVYTTLMGAVLMIGMCYLFIAHLGWGLEGAALVYFIFRVFMITTISALIRVTGIAK